jgi:hypothetical protein
MTVELEARSDGIFVALFGYDVWIERELGGMLEGHPAGKRWALHRDERGNGYLYAGPLVLTYGPKRS